MKVVVREESGIDFATYARIPIAFRVASEFRPPSTGRPGSGLGAEVPLEHPYTKDYDALPGGHPSDWARRFDTSGWGVVTAWQGKSRVGGIVLARGPGVVDHPESRRDRGVLWDVRVAPEARGQGVGSKLLAAAEAWARSRGCTVLEVETQNINVAACRFYQSHGFELREVEPRAYPTLPGEIRLLWYKTLE